MPDIQVYDKNGEPHKKFFINDDVEYVHGRVYKGKNCYYKGIGVPYRSHHILSENITDEYDHIKNSDVFYVGHAVSKKCFSGKVGVFTEKYQPFFPDSIGSCASKEGPVVINSINFEKSSIEVFDCIEIDSEEDQYYYEVDYKCKRKKYTDDGDPKKLRDLIDHMICNDWNFLWDKGAINDVSFDGRVCDVGDLFISNELKHKLGTVYSVLYSLCAVNKNKYYEFLKFNNLEHPKYYGDFWFIYNSICILQQNNIDTSKIFYSDDFKKNYKNAVLNYLVVGKNAAYCACDAFIGQGDKVMKTYVDRAKIDLKVK